MEEYRKNELHEMRANFYENTMQYNEKRFNFVHKIPNKNAENIEDFYQSRRTIYRKRKWETLTYKEADEQ